MTWLFAQAKKEIMHILTSSFSGQSPTRPETRGSGAGQGGAGIPELKFFRGRDPRGVEY